MLLRLHSVLIQASPQDPDAGYDCKKFCHLTHRLVFCTVDFAWPGWSPPSTWTEHAAFSPQFKRGLKSLNWKIRRD